MKHTRPPTSEDIELLALANRGDKHVVLAPIFFNGEARMALAYFGENDGQAYIRVLGVLVEPKDEVLDLKGNHTAFTPPVSSSRLN